MDVVEKMKQIEPGRLESIAESIRKVASLSSVDNEPQE
jgi:hypothetical protein